MEISKTTSNDFDEYYKKIYGLRWQSLRESLLLPAVTVPYNEGLAVPYYLDSASILAALSLRLPSETSVESGHSRVAGRGSLETREILDACAAPGGKTLIIASKMKEHSFLIANELSAERRRRLSAVLDKHLSAEMRSKIRVSGFDAAKAAGRHSEQGRFLAILLDVPCSSERHVLQSKTAFKQWTASRPKFLSGRQWALLSAAFLLLAPGGSLVYVTCSINPGENDRVAERLLQKYAGPKSGEVCMTDRPDFPEGEETDYGKIILPDVCGGAGPMYVARFKKAAN